MPSRVAVTDWTPEIASAAVHETSPALPTSPPAVAPSKDTVGSDLSIVMTSWPTTETFPPLSVAR